MTRGQLRLGTALALTTMVACHASHDDRTRPSSAPRAASKLPEDALAGNLALARWTEHLEEEERSRQANYDRRRLPEHQALLATFEQSRSRYDQARTKAAVAREQAKFRARVPALRSSLLQLDRWGRSSHLAKDYRDLLELLESDYPSARLAAVEGNPESSQRLATELGARLAKAHDWLKLAATAEEE